MLDNRQTCVMKLKNECLNAKSKKKHINTFQSGLELKAKFIGNLYT